MHFQRKGIISKTKPNSEATGTQQNRNKRALRHSMTSALMFIYKIKMNKIYIGTDMSATGNHHPKKKILDCSESILSSCELHF